MLRQLKALLKQSLRRILPDRLLSQLILLSQLVFQIKTFFKSAVTKRIITRKYRAMEGVRLNVGCGGRPTNGWINFDMNSYPGVEYWDCRKGLPFNDAAVTAIYSEHFLEHLEYDGEVQKFLSECLRCLSQFGVLRVSVPDAGEYLKLYANDDWDEISKRRPLVKEGDHYRDPWIGGDYSTKMQFINAVFRQNGEHKYAYDAETLVQLLRSIGFARVSQMRFGVSSDPKMTADTAERRSESLYVEASKT